MDIIKIDKNLYISGFKAARRARGFYRICVSDSKAEASIANVHYPIYEDDVPQSFILQKDRVASKIAKKLQEGRKVLVYCHQGINRSVSCVIYFLIKYYNTSYKEAYRYVHHKHPQEDMMPEIYQYLGAKYR